MGDYLEYSQPGADFVAETPDLKPLIDAHGAMVRGGMDPATAANVTRALYAPVMSHGHLQRWLQVAWPVQQPPAPTSQQHASGAAVAALVQRTGAPPQQAAAQMTQLFSGRPYQPPPQRATPTPISELHHYGVLSQVYGPTDPSEPPDANADARGALTGSEPGTHDPQLSGAYYPDNAEERHKDAATALTGAAPTDTIDPDTQDADARSAIGGY